MLSKWQLGSKKGKILINVAWLLGDKFFRLGLSLIVGIWLARYLAPEQYGLLSYILAFVTFFDPFAKMGIDAILIRNLAKNPGEKNLSIGSGFIIRLIAGFISFIACSGVAYLLSSLPEKRIVLFTVIISSSLIFQAFRTFDLWFYSQTDAKQVVLVENVAYFIVSILRIILIIIRSPLINFLWLLFLEEALNSIGKVLVYRANGNLLYKLGFSFSISKQLIAESWPLIFSDLMILAYMKIDQVMIGQMMTDKAVGVYAVAVKIAEIWYFIPAVIVQSVLPSLVKLREESTQMYYKRLQQLFDLLTALSYAVAIVFMFFSIPLINLLYGEQYAEAGSILIVYIWSGVFVSLGIAAGPWNIAERLTRFVAIKSICAAILNILINFFLIRSNGIMGATIATVISQLFACVLSYSMFLNTRPVFKMQLLSLSLISPFKSLSTFFLRYKTF